MSLLSLPRRLAFAAVLMSVITLTVLLPTSGLAQYVRTDLVTDQTDAQLVNGWGLTRFATSPFWVSDNGTGFSTLYNGAGTKRSLVVTIPPAPGSGAAMGTPTGIVANGTGQFKVSANGETASAAFIFATLDGTISGWAPSVNATHAIIASNQSGIGAVYTGLALGTSPTSGKHFLFATDNGPNSRIDVFDSDFNLVSSFTDPAIPQSFAPYAVHNINGQLWVAFGGNKAASGFVDVFDADGNLIRHFAANGPLHSPWGMALAPADFGPFSNALLIANNIPKGRINAFDPDTGQFLGALRDPAGQPIVIDQVWGIFFGGDAPNNTNGAHNQLFFAAGPSNYAHGAFGVISVGP
jgi:uncharacterized protein (TIGR03118 family)